jgi:hypothetical protein
MYYLLAYSVCLFADVIIAMAYTMLKVSKEAADNIRKAIVFIFVTIARAILRKKFPKLGLQKGKLRNAEDPAQESRTDSSSKDGESTPYV